MPRVGIEWQASRTDGAAFTTTRWTVVLAAGDPGQQHEALARLCQTYWPPLYAFLRRRGYSPHDAEDVVQGFFERFLERDYLRDVSREKGRFRSFLMASLRHYVANQQRDHRTQRRGGANAHVHLDIAGAERCETASVPDQSPEVVFDRVWAETIMETAARRLRTEYERSGKAELFDHIREWLAKEAKPGDYAAKAQLLALAEGTLAVTVHRMRQRFRELAREEVSHTVQSPAEVNDEMRYLLRVLTA